MARGSPKKVLRYSDEFKVKAVKLSELPDVQIKDIAEALDIHPFMLSKWRKEYREGLLKARTAATAKPKSKPKIKDGGLRPAELRKFAALKRQHELLKEEHEILKKFIRFSSAQRRQSSSS